MSSGEPLLTLVPAGQTPKIRSLFAAKDRDRINLGKEVRLYFTNLGSSSEQISYQRKVTQISAGLSEKFERQGYPVEIEFLNVDTIDLSPMYPGVRVEVVLMKEGETVLS